MDSVLIAMPEKKDADKIADMLNRRGPEFETCVCRTAADVLRVANEKEYGIVICRKKLPDMYFAELEECLPHCFGLVLITTDASLELYSEKAARILIPFRASELRESVTLLMRRVSGRTERQKSRKRSAAEQLMIDEAKHALMEAKGLTEPEAYRYIQKNSMDAGRTLLESAQMIMALLFAK